MSEAKAGLIQVPNHPKLVLGVPKVKITNHDGSAEPPTPAPREE